LTWESPGRRKRKGGWKFFWGGKRKKGGEKLSAGEDRLALCARGEVPTLWDLEQGGPLNGEKAYLFKKKGDILSTANWGQEKKKEGNVFESDILLKGGGGGKRDPYAGRGGGGKKKTTLLEEIFAPLGEENGFYPGGGGGGGVPLQFVGTKLQPREEKKGR